jgi:hypothetical protein
MIQKSHSLLRHSVVIVQMEKIVPTVKTANVEKDKSGGVSNKFRISPVSPTKRMAL